MPIVLGIEPEEIEVPLTRGAGFSHLLIAEDPETFDVAPTLEFRGRSEEIIWVSALSVDQTEATFSFGATAVTEVLASGNRQVVWMVGDVCYGVGEVVVRA